MHPDITDFIHLHPNHLPDRLADVMGHFHSNLWIHHNVQVHKKDRTAWRTRMPWTFYPLT